MRKKIMLPITVLFAALMTHAVPSLHSSNLLPEVKTKYPYALLGDSHGVLKEDDLAINNCEATPVPFSEKSTSYPYWQCFEVNKAKIFCDGNKYDEDEQTRLTVMVISGENQGETHEYLTRRAFPLSDCRAYVKDWKRVTKGEKYICFAGPFTNRAKNESGKWEYNWTFDRFKTLKGCESYFVGGCSLKYQIKHGCKLEAAK